MGMVEGKGDLVVGFEGLGGGVVQRYWGSGVDVMEEDRRLS